MEIYYLSTSDKFVLSLERHFLNLKYSLFHDNNQLQPNIFHISFVYSYLGMLYDDVNPSQGLVNILVQECFKLFLWYFIPEY